MSTATAKSLPQSLRRVKRHSENWLDIPQCRIEALLSKKAKIIMCAALNVVAIIVTVRLFMDWRRPRLWELQHGVPHAGGPFNHCHTAWHFKEVP